MAVRTTLLPHTGDHGGDGERCATGRGDRAGIGCGTDGRAGHFARISDDALRFRELVRQHRFAAGFEGDRAGTLLARQQRLYTGGARAIGIGNAVRDDVDERIAEFPGLEIVELDRLAVREVALVVRHRDAERLLEEGLRGVLERAGERAHRERGRRLGFFRPTGIGGRRRESRKLGFAEPRERRLGPGRVVGTTALVTERLEAPGLQRMDAQQITRFLDAEGLREQVGDLLDHDGKRDLLAARGLEAATIYKECVAGAEQRFEEQVPIEAAAVVLLRLRAREGVPSRGAGRSRETVVVHADHRDDAERHGAHRLHRADGDGAGAGAVAAARQREGVAQHRGDACGVELERGPRRIRGLVAEQLLQRGRYTRALPGARFGQRTERIHDALEARAPLLGGRGCRKTLLQPLQLMADLGQHAEAQRLVAARQVDGHRRTETVGRRHDGDAAGVRHQHTEREPLEREAHGVLVDGGLVVVRAVVGIPGPTQARVDDEIFERAEVGIIDAELGAQRLAAEQVEQPRRGDARADEADDIEQHGSDGVGVGEAEVGDVHGDRRDGARAVMLAAEHRRDERRVGGEIGRHHQHMTRLERGIRCEATQQIVAQRLALAQRAVAGVDLDGGQRAGIGVEHTARPHAVAQTG